MEDRSEVLLDRALELGALSGSVQKLLELTRRDDAEIGPVVDELGQNPSLTAAVLRAANSPLYGQQRSVADLSRAVVVLGMQELHDVVASAAMMAAFARPDPLSQRLQSSAPLSASIAHKLAGKLGGPVQTAYLAGLMCELGALACLALDPPFAELYWSTHSDPRRRFADETVRYGCPTTQIGGKILAASAIPAQVAAAVSATGLEPAGELDVVARVVAFARLAAVALLSASEHGVPDVLWAELNNHAALVGLEHVEHDLLAGACLAAAGEASLTLRGDFTPPRAHPDNDVAPTPDSMPSLRSQHASHAPLVAVLSFGLVLAGALVWYLAR